MTESNVRVPVETLPIGELGLPQTLLVMEISTNEIHKSAGNSSSIPPTETIPILRPGLLILTKLKRCVHLIDSTRPKSIRTLDNDTKDIVYLMNWLIKNDQKVDFVGYKTPTPNKLYEAVGEMIKHWGNKHRNDWVDMMKSVLDKDDLEKALSQASDA